MSEWIEIQPFGYGDVKAVDGKDLAPINTLTNAAGSIAPPIGRYTDLWLRDENERVIADENGEGISLEGLLYA